VPSIVFLTPRPRRPAEGEPPKQSCVPRRPPAWWLPC
jgi:hypothetical protein